MASTLPPLRHDSPGSEGRVLPRAPPQRRQHHQREQEVPEVVAAHVRLKAVLRLLTAGGWGEPGANGRNRKRKRPWNSPVWNSVKIVSVHVCPLTRDLQYARVVDEDVQVALLPLPLGAKVADCTRAAESENSISLKPSTESSHLTSRM